MYTLQSGLHDSELLLLWHLQDFLRNNRGINDGGDLPEDYMSSLYERIQTNEIKMKVSIATNRMLEPAVFHAYKSASHPDSGSMPAHGCWPLHVLMCPTTTCSHFVNVHKSSVGYVWFMLQEPGSDPASIAASRAAQTAGQGGGGWMDTILNLIPGRKQKATDEPNEDAIKRTHDYLRSVHMLCDSLS